MNKKLVLGLGLTAILFSSAAFSYTITGHAHALIRSAITSSEAQQMNFGAIDANATGGTVTLTTSGTATATNGLVLSANKSQGKITITADPDTNLTISIADSTLTIDVGTGTPMVINNFQTNPAPVGGQIPTGTTGIVSLEVGADLIVNADQEQGAYSGSYVVTFNY